MKCMAQASWRRGEALRLVELPTPDPHPDEIRVAVRAIGVNPVDWKMREFGPLRLAARWIGPPPPVVVGVDFAGVVDAVGSAAHGFRPGDRVVGGVNFALGQRGSYADTVFVRPSQLCPLPDSISFEIGAALPVAGVTAWMSLGEIGGLAPLRDPGAGARAQAPAEPDATAPRVLVLGASGGVGQFALQFAKHGFGAFVVGVCSSRNAALVRELGAAAVIEYDRGDALEQAAVHAPYRVVVDCVGSYPGAACRRLLARGGRHVIVSGDTPRDLLELMTPPFTSRAVLGRPTRRRLEAVVDALITHRLQVRIAQRFALCDAEQAHALSRGGRVAGKLILLP